MFSHNRTEYLEIGATPCDEDCAQAGTIGYSQKAEKECRAYRQQLQRVFPIPESLKDDIAYTTRHFSGGGGYYEVVVEFNPQIEEAVTFAYNVENNSPTNWDEVARVELETN